MSIHLVECAARLDLPASTKLALMAFADSADSRTGIGMPGLEQVQQWACLGRSRALEVTADLVARGYLAKRSRGVRGRRAEYVVFPRGCCAEHPVLETASDEPDPEPETGSAGPDNPSTTGSASPDADARPRALVPSGSPTGSDVADPDAQQGPDRVRQLPDPSPATSTYPPNPPAPGGARGSRSCAKHKTRAANCRGCGTTSRQVLARQRAERTAAEREKATARTTALRLELEAARARPRSPEADAEVHRLRSRLRARLPEGATA